MSQEDHIKPEQDPSVLDYIKSRIKFWTHNSNSLFQSPVENLQETFVDSDLNLVKEIKDSTLSPLVKSKPFPWLLVGAFGLSIIAQLLLEPTSAQRNALPGLVFYGLALILLLTSIFTHPKHDFQYRSEAVHGFSLTFRAGYLVSGLLLSILSFFLFKNGRFHFLNSLVWLSGLGLVIAAFWGSLESSGKRFHKFWHYFSKGQFNIKIDYWHILALVVIILVLVFRLANLDLVPAEMISDQAERLLAVFDIQAGNHLIFTPRNNGSEVLQFYWTDLLLKVSGTELSFGTMKAASAIAGLVTLLFIYLLGREVGDRWTGLIALAFCGIAYWPNILARSVLGGVLVPLFASALLLFLIKGLRKSKVEYFILAGLALGLGLMSYRVFLVAPFVVMAAVALYCSHAQSRGKRQQALWGMLIILIIGLIVILPLLRVIIAQPRVYFFRIFSRLGQWERPYPGNPWVIFAKNLWQGLTMFFWTNGNQWVESVAGRPALDFVSGGVFMMSSILMLVSYLRKKHWLDLFLLLTVVILLLPSVLSIAFPEENPSLSQASGAMVAVFIIIAKGLRFLSERIRQGISTKRGPMAAGLIILVLLSIAIGQNKTLLFEKYAENYQASAMNTREMAAVLEQYDATIGSFESAWIVAYPHWVDTKLVAISAGRIGDDFAIQSENIPGTLPISSPKLFLLNKTDLEGLNALISVYPDGFVSEYRAQNLEKSFLMFYILPSTGEGN